MADESDVSNTSDTTALASWRLERLVRSMPPEKAAKFLAIRDADVPPTPAPEWRPEDTVPAVVADPDLEPHLFALCAVWAVRGSPLPARCDVCGAVEETDESGRTRLVHLEAAHAAAAKRNAAQLDGPITAPRRVATDDDDVTHVQHTAQPMRFRLRRAFGEED